MHFKPEEIPLRSKDYGTGYMRSIKAGEMEIGASWITKPVDSTKFYEGLPGKTCPCDHYGFVFSGSIRARYDSGEEEIIRAGSVYFIPKGHVLIYDEPTYHLEINPHAELEQLMNMVNENMAAGFDPDAVAPKPPGA